MKNNEINLIYKLIDKAVVGVDTYNHNDSRWLIFTDSKKWVIELTKEGTLWYNYYFFQNIFKLISLDLVENQHYITKWVEDNFINMVKHTVDWTDINPETVEDTIQNGVKDTFLQRFKGLACVENTIQNGVKEINMEEHHRLREVVQTVKNGIKDTKPMSQAWKILETENVIQYGVRDTISDTASYTTKVESIIQNGVMDTKVFYGCLPQDVEDTIQNGIKETESIASHRTWKSEEVIQNGVKETKTPGDGNIESTIKWMKENKTNNVPDMIDTIIKNGIRKTEGGILFDESKIDTVIDEGIKETHDDVMPHTGRVEGVIKNGVKKNFSIVKPENKIN